MTRDNARILTGTRIRQRRTDIGLRQVDLAERAGISPSYLNLIEHNRRRIAGKLLFDIAAGLGIEAKHLSEDAQTSLLGELRSGFAGHEGKAQPELDRIDDFASRFPGWADTLVQTQRRVTELERTIEVLSDRMTHDPHLSEALHEVLTTVTAIRSTSGILTGGGGLDTVWQERFQKNLDEDARRLAESAASLVKYLDDAGDVDQNLSSPQAELDKCFGRMGWHVAGFEQSDLTERQAQTVAQDLAHAAPELTSSAVREMAVNRFMSWWILSQKMPVESFSKALITCGWDPILLADQFDVSVEEVFQRFATLPPTERVSDVGLVSCDAAGNLTCRKALNGFNVPSFDGACARWPLFSALVTPGELLVNQIGQSQGRAGDADFPRFVALSWGWRKQHGGFGGAVVRGGHMLLIPQDSLEKKAMQEAGGVMLDIGSSCRICMISDCPARREPAILGGAV
ncbi:helix-turn-helix transcriptional regulator [Halocynthiibacter namhaensis]|uniref:helix-turn-helix transcriptional regulator n=1 Tax=Halocynthiibacter namhaensis TaxID=1290553 RepID=UPI0005798340|nr:helix-turn-helix transcriptional regulator [Halocynthiibacter namhaensis]